MRKKGKRTKGLLVIAILLFMTVFITVNLNKIARYFNYSPAATAINLPSNDMERAMINYSDDVLEASKEFNLPYEYMMALIVLECSGNKPSGERFEKGVYRRLLQVQSGERKKYENIRKKHLVDCEDGAVRNLASSWGPFQLMGYKCVAMDIKIKDLRGSSAVHFAAMWMDKEYGKHLRKGHFKDSFHIHNTGQKFPRSGVAKTHDPKYVDKGLNLIEYFKKHKPDDE